MNSKKDLIETKISSEALLKGKLLNAWRDEVRLPNGKTGIREYITHPGAVIMIPLFPDGDTILVKQFRYPVGKTFLELPAGKLEGTEPREEAVQRELAEEIGYVSHMLTPVAEFYPCIGYSNEKMWLFVAEALMEARAETDHDEFIETVRMPFREAVAMACSGEIDDMKTIAGIMLGQNFLSRRAGR